MWKWTFSHSFLNWWARFGFLSLVDSFHQHRNTQSLVYFAQQLFTFCCWISKNLCHAHSTRKWSEVVMAGRRMRLNRIRPIFTTLHIWLCVTEYKNIMFIFQIPCQLRSLRRTWRFIPYCIKPIKIWPSETNERQLIRTENQHFQISRIIFPTVSMFSNWFRYRTKMQCVNKFYYQTIEIASMEEKKKE